MIIYVSKLKIKGYLKLLPFLAKALPLMDAAKKVPGNLHSDSKILGALENVSFTVWENEETMMAYFSSANYKELSLKTMLSAKEVKVCQWEADDVPEWEDIFERLSKF